MRDVDQSYTEVKVNNINKLHVFTDIDLLLLSNESRKAILCNNCLDIRTYKFDYRKLDVCPVCGESYEGFREYRHNENPTGIKIIKDYLYNTTPYEDNFTREEY